jgi:hypothetical protein
MHQESIFEDGPVLLQSGAQRQADGLTEIAGLGADTVRALVTWSDAARGDWSRYDGFVRDAHALGLNVLLTPVGPPPRAAEGCHRAGERSCSPSPKRYGAFVRVLARRYDGAHSDAAGVLPRVDRWSLWNEPNQASWLAPQYARRHGHLVEVGALRYRKLAAAGIAALRDTGHGSETILLGETSPIGREAGPPADRSAQPVPFLRTLLCLAGPRCRHVHELRATGFAHHPYTQGAHDAPGVPVTAGQISFNNVRVLKRLLAAGSRHGVIPHGLPIWYTEFGYQSNPPDPRLGVPPARQAKYINQADAVAAADPRIVSVSQYELVDDPEIGNFQTGLERYGTLAPKPALAAYRLPLWLTRHGSSVTVYGQVRPAPNGSTQSVAIERDGTTVRTVSVHSRYGQFRVRIPYAAGSYRLRWGALTSRAATAP